MSRGWLGGENPNEGGRQRETRWLTPRPIVEALGRFDLDPCGAPGYELADRTYLLERDENGLMLPWYGRVWCNPPYGRQAEPFMARMAQHRCGTALVFARTETVAFHRYVWDAATAVLFIKGRIKFLKPDGVTAPGAAGAPSCLVAYGAADAVKLRESGLGKVVRV